METLNRNVNRFVGAMKQETIDARWEVPSLDKEECKELTLELCKAFEHSLE